MKQDCHLRPFAGGPTALRTALLTALVATSGCFSDSANASGNGNGNDDGDDDDGTTGAPAGDSTTAPPAATTEVADTTGDASTAATTDAMTGTVTGAVDDGSGSGSTSGDGGSGSDGSGTTGLVPLGVDALVPGDLVITEVMWNPTCNMDACEWLELLNTTASPVNLLDLYIQDIDQSVGNQGRVTDDVIVAPNGLAVLARGAANWPYAVMLDAAYGPSPGLTNGSPDSVSVLNGSGILDETPTFPFGADEGIAWSLSANAQDAVSNDLSANWCLATTVLPAGPATEFGTPGVPNEDCG